MWWTPVQLVRVDGGQEAAAAAAATMVAAAVGAVTPGVAAKAMLPHGSQRSRSLQALSASSSLW